MKSVLYLMSFVGSGGAERYMISLIEGLKNKDFKFYLGVSNITNSIFEEELRKLGVNIVLLPIKKVYDVKAALNIRTFCKKNNIDIIHTHFLRENCVAVLSKLFGNTAKIINTCHMNWENSFKVQVLNRLITRFDYKIIAVSNSVKSILEKEGIRKNKIQVIYNGVDCDYFESSIDSTIDDEFDMGKDIFKILTVARFNEEKGYFYLIDIAKALSNKINLDKVRFVLVGDGELKEDVMRYAMYKGIDKYIIFTGIRNDIKNILSGADLYISPSKNEALGISILEAMACGVPVIATNVGGTPEILGEDNEFLVNYGDKDVAVSDILKIYNNENNIKEKISSNGKKRIKSIFNLETMVQTTYNLYMNAE